MFFEKYKIILAFIVVLAVSFLVYTFMINGADQASQRGGGTGLVASPALGVVGGGENVIGAEIIRALNQIDALTLDRGIFNDPVYASLIDWSREIPPEPVGKDNPFAAIGVSSRFTFDNQLDFNNATTSDSGDSPDERRLPSGLGTSGSTR